ncbi:MAG: fibronectin type III domain-containing protein [Ilumatobacteraceae bacterium]
MDLQRVLRATKYAGVAVGGYLVISTGVNIVESAETTRQAADEAAAAYTDEILAADASTSTVVIAPPAAEMAQPADGFEVGLPVPSPAVAPDAVEGLDVVPGDTSVVVTWVQIPGLVYDVELTGPLGERVGSVRTDTGGWQFDGLQPASAHIARVRAVNPVSELTSEWSEQLFGTP